MLYGSLTSVFMVVYEINGGSKSNMPANIMQKSVLIVLINKLACQMNVARENRANILFIFFLAAER